MLYRQIDTGYYWASTIFNNINGHHTYVREAFLSATGRADKRFEYALRCILKLVVY